MGEIDWTGEPQSEYERAVRAAIIAQIENGGDDAWTCGVHLRGLLDTTEGHLWGYGAASDLAGAIARNKKLVEDEHADSDREERAQLLNAAQRAVAEAGVPKELPANVVRFVPRVADASE